MLAATCTFHIILPGLNEPIAKYFYKVHKKNTTTPLMNQPEDKVSIRYDITISKVRNLTF